MQVGLVLFKALHFHDQLSLSLCMLFAAMTVDDVLKMNPDISTNVVEGQTILLPSGKLSMRDREILDGIGPNYRVYPVRGAETLEDIMSKRGILLSEVEALNPGVDLKKLAGGLTAACKDLHGCCLCSIVTAAP